MSLDFQASVAVRAAHILRMLSDQLSLIIRSRISSVESALFLENLRHYSKITWPLTQGQYKGGKVASFALWKSQGGRFPKM